MQPPGEFHHPHRHPHRHFHHFFFRHSDYPPGPPPGGETRPPPPHDKQISVGPRLTLFDAERRHIIGRKHSIDGLVLRAVMVNDRTVGWIGLTPLEHFAGPLQREFLSRQARAFYLTGILAVFLAALGSLLLTRRLMAPLGRLAEGTRALSSRKFDTRVVVESRDELGRLAEDFNGMAEELEKYEAMRRQWISDISHELRTPLAVLRGEIEAMQDGIRPVTPKSLDSLHSEVLHLGKIVADLHDLSILESGDLAGDKSPVDIEAVLEATLESFRGRLAERSIEVRKDYRGTGPSVVEGSDMRLRQLFINILENAHRYADAPGVLLVDRSFSLGRVVIRIEDSGPGVPPEVLDRLFDRLYRVDAARSRSHGGSGIGLAICKAVVEAHGGEIRAENSAAGGLAVIVEIPLSLKAHKG